MLFWEREFRELSESALAEMRQRIRGESADYLLRVNEEDYLQHVIPGFTIDTFAIDFSGVSISSGERDIPGHIFPGQQYDVDPDQFYTKHVVTYHVPVSGELSLLGMRPTQYIDWTAEIDISDGEILFEVIDFNNDPAFVKREGDKFLANLKTNADYLARDIKLHNERVPTEARKIFQARKAELQQRSKSLEAIGIPIKKAENVPATFEVPKVRKKLPPKPAAEKKAAEPEYTIPDDIYHEILRIISDTGHVFERLPSTYKGKGEEALRDFLIIQLEPHFEFSATGETFNKEGKTDILVRHEKKNVFVAECKFWGGQKKHLETIDQILKYLTWRDSKTAVIYFVKGKQIAPVLTAVEQVTPKHPNFLSTKGKQDESWYRFEFHLPGDKERKIQLAILCFHLPEEGFPEE